MSEEAYIQIRKYLTGNLTDSERDDFEQRLKTDTALKSTVESFSKLMDGRTNESLLNIDKDDVLEPLDEHLRNKLDDKSKLNVEMFQKLDSSQHNEPREVNMPASKVAFSKIWYAIAAAVVLLIVTTLLVIGPGNDQKSLTNRVLSESINRLDVPAGRGDDDDHWRTAYKEGRFEKTIQLLTSIEEQTKEQRFYLGLSLLYLEKHTQAADVLIDPEFQGTNYYNLAKWYASLAIYLSGDRQKSIKFWKQIASDKNVFKSKEATELLRLSGVE